MDGSAESAIRQGLTSSVIGNCGHGPAPAPKKALAKLVTIGVNASWNIDFEWNSFGEYLDALIAKGQSMNVAALVPHGTIRIAVMGYDSGKPTVRQISRMCSLVDEAMSAGAVGISTGLEYSPGRYADQAELVDLSRVVGRYGGVYASHIRERGDKFEDSVREALNIGRLAEVPVQLSHLAPRPYAPSGVLERVLSTIHSVSETGQDVGIDTFPDTWGPAHLLDLVPPWVYEGSDDDVLIRLRDPSVVEQARDYFENESNFLLRLGGMDKFFLSHSSAHPEFVSLSLESIANQWGIDELSAIFRLAADDGKDFGSVFFRREGRLKHVNYYLFINFAEKLCPSLPWAATPVPRTFVSTSI